MLSKIYLEITNICNLNCSFCHKTKRKKRYMSVEEFEYIIDKIRGKAKYLYLHLMGEPLLHPDISRMADIAKNAGFDVMLTTNGTLLKEKGAFIHENSSFKKVSISLQATDKNNPHIKDTDGYISDVCDFAKKCADKDIICALRLWNLENGKNEENGRIYEQLKRHFPDPWIKNRSGFKLFNSPLGQNEVYLEFGERFEWPDSDGRKRSVSTCYALRDQIGILCDGTVVPCCLDAEGDISLGNIFENALDDILSSPRAVKLLESFKSHCPSEQLCCTCGFAERFNK